MANSPRPFFGRSLAVHGMCVDPVVAIKRKGGPMKFILSVAIALVFAVPESAGLGQYIDTNGDQVNPAVDVRTAVGIPTTIAAYLDTNHDEHSSPQTRYSYTSPSSSGAQTPFGTRDGVAHGGASATAAVPVPYPVLTSNFLRLHTDDAPYAVTTADFNGDGRMDIAAIAFGFNAASIFIAEGDGVFRNYKDRVNYTTGVAPRSIQSADFNGDGKPDIVVANRTSNTLSIILGNGDGTLAPRTDVAVGTNPEVVVVRDFNADGKRDVAVTNFGSNTVSVLLGNGDGTFGTQTQYPTGTGPIGLVAGDISIASNVIDLIAANSLSNTVSVWA